MPEESKTVAERYVRSLCLEQPPRIADLCVLALERALVRDGYWFSIVDPARFDTNVRPRIVQTRAVAASHRTTGWNAPIPVDDHVVVAERCRHVVDWIVASERQGVAWLDRCDSEGRPLKLKKFGSLDRAVAEADKAMRRFASAAASVAANAGDEVVHARLDDGWTLVRLLTPTALDRESAGMQHCIGQGAYDDVLAKGVAVFLSLRDPKGKPHATLDLRSAQNGRHAVHELQGKQNVRPIERHMSRMRPWMRENIECMEANGRPAWWSRLVYDSFGNAHPLEALPERLVLTDPFRFVLNEGDALPSELLRSVCDVWAIAGEDRTSPIVLPEVVDCTGMVSLSGNVPFVFGRSFDASKLTAKDCRLEDIPKDFRTGTLHATNCALGFVPKECGHGLMMLQNSSARFEDGSRIPTLYLTEALVDVLPHDLHADEVTIMFCPVAEIPDGSRIRKLTVRGHSLQRIGHVEGLRKLHLEDVSAGLRFPAGMELDDQVDGCAALTIKGPGIPSNLPDNLKIRGTLQMIGTSGVRLPEGLDVDRLHLSCDVAPALPDGTRIRKDLILMGPESVEIGTDCEIGSIVPYERDHTTGALHLRPTIEFDPSMSRAHVNGTIERRDPAPSF